MCLMIILNATFSVIMYNYNEFCTIKLINHEVSNQRRVKEIDSKVRKKELIFQLNFQLVLKCSAE